MGNSSWTSDHTRLSEILAELYSDKVDAVRLIREAGMNPAAFSLGDKAINNWHEIVRQANAQGLLIPLIERALIEFPRNETLKEILAAVKTGQKNPAQTPGPSAKPVEISDVQLRDFIVEHFSKRDITDLLFSVTDLLHKAGKLPANTTIDIDSFSSLGEPTNAIAIEMIRYFKRRLWTPFLIEGVRAAQGDVFRDKFGA